MVAFCQNFVFAKWIFLIISLPVVEISKSISNWLFVYWKSQETVIMESTGIRFRIFKPLITSDLFMTELLFLKTHKMLYSFKTTNSSKYAKLCQNFNNM